MSNTNPTTDTRIPPKRSAWSILMLLALVLAITAQLITGFAMMADFSDGLLAAHISVGGIAVLLTIAEWLWLFCSPAGRHRLFNFFGSGSTSAEWSEAAFLIVASITVVFGAILASIIYLGVSLPFATLLPIHQELAKTVAVIYIIHVILAVRRTILRRGAERRVES